MSNTTQKTYVNSIWVDEKVFGDGGSFLKLNIKADQLSEFLIKNKNDKGYVKLVITKKKGQVEEGKSAFYTYLDTWQPSTQKSAPQQVKSAPKKTTVPVVQDDNDMF